MCFFWGGLLLYFYRWTSSFRPAARGVMAIVNLSLTGLALLNLYSGGLLSPLLLPHPYFLIVFEHLIFPASCILSFVQSFESIQNARAAAVFSELGNLTYASYLVHFPIQILFVLITDSHRIPREAYLSPGLFLLFMTAVFVSSFLIYRYYEMPIQDMIRAKWLKGSGGARGGY